MRKKLVLHHDIDEVLTDFNGYFVKRIAELGITLPPRTKENPDPIERILDDVMIPVYQVFEHLPVNPWTETYSKQLLRIVKEYDIELIFVSVVGSGRSREATHQKRRWLAAHGFEGYEVIGVPNPESKSLYAHSGSVLIDDNPRCIHHYKKAGGKTLLFRPDNWNYILTFLECLAQEANNDQSDKTAGRICQVR